MDSRLKAVPGANKDGVKGAIGTGPPYEAGGIKTSLHGYIYQIKLTMFFIIRALMKNFDFYIGTEVNAAESFDDLVFKFVNNTEKRVIFLQAKHRLDEEKTINESDLIKEDGHFSMRKYYYSFCNILVTKYFKKMLEDPKVTFVIYTNIDIDKSIQDNFDEVEIGEFASNGFLRPGSAAAFAKFYKIKPDTHFYNKLSYFLGKNELPLTLAQHLARNIVENKNKTERKSINIDKQFKRYRECLLHKIFDHGIDTNRKQNSYYVSFKEGFLLSKDLPADVLKFRQDFIQCFISETNYQYITHETITAKLSGVKFTVTKDFVKGGVSNQNKVNEFLDALIFAVNQPSEVELGNIVINEVGKYAGLIDRKSVACKFQIYILDWVKQKQGMFLQKVDVDEQFAVWGQADQSLRFINEIKNVGNTFEQDYLIDNISNFLKDDDGQIICIYYKEQLVTEVKLCQAFDYGGNINDEFIFSDICSLSGQVNTKICPVKAFNSQFCNNAFIVIRNNSEINNKEEMLLRKLLDILKTDIQKKKAEEAKKKILILIPLNHARINEKNDLFRNLDCESVNKIILEAPLQ